jgi:O-antigen ligase
MQAFSSSTIYLLLCFAILAIPCLFLLCIKHPNDLTLSFLAILFLFPASTWGQLDIENTIYSRGTGLLYFPLLNWLLWIAAIIVFTIQSKKPLIPQAALTPNWPLAKYLQLFLILMLAHLMIGLMAGQDLAKILGLNGFINVINMLIMSWMIAVTHPTTKQQNRTLLILLGIAALRSVYGLMRYFLLDGDPTNPYRNFESLDIKLVYFDIADNYVAAFAAFCIAWLLWMPGKKLSLPVKIGLSGLFIAEILTVVLSFRRSSLIGLALMFGVLLWRLPWKKQIQFATLGILIMLSSIFTVTQQRLQFNSEKTDFISSLLYDVGPNRSTELPRFYELETAAHSLQDNWLLGLGSWGRFFDFENILDYHFGEFDYVHSGFGHILLKTGVLGLLLFSAIFITFIWRYQKYRPHYQGNQALLADAGCAGLFFWLPTLLVGTPIIEFRTMLLLGFTLALPLLTPTFPKLARNSTNKLYAAT